jgi:hypothetical protein
MGEQRHSSKHYIEAGGCSAPWYTLGAKLEELEQWSVFGENIRISAPAGNQTQIFCFFCSLITTNQVTCRKEKENPIVFSIIQPQENNSANFTDTSEKESIDKRTFKPESLSSSLAGGM